MTMVRATGKITPALLAVLCSVRFAILSNEHGRSKRIVFGEILPSHLIYKTGYYVNIRTFHGLMSHVVAREHYPLEIEHLADTSQKCGGTLITPELVLSACHCFEWREFYIRKNVEITGEEDNEGEFSVTQKDGILVKSIRINKKATKIDAILSNYVIYAGSTQWWHMRQRRHARQIFPHGHYATDRESHDVCILRACFAFKVDKETVDLAPMDIHNSRRRFYEIVKKGAICMFLGFGNAGWNWIRSSSSGHSINNDEHNNERYVDQLRIGWKTAKCPSQCKLNYDYDGLNCIFCTAPLDGKYVEEADTDSGGPVVCDGFLTAVFNSVSYVTHLTTPSPDKSSTEEEDVEILWKYPSFPVRDLTHSFVKSNDSEANSYAIHCIKDYLTESHLQYLISIEPKAAVSREHSEFVSFVPTKSTTRRRKWTPPFP